MPPPVQGIKLGYDANGMGYYGSNGDKYYNGSGVAYGATYTTGDVIGVALDLTDGTITFYKDGVSPDNSLYHRFCIGNSGLPHGKIWRRIISDHGLCIQLLQIFTPQRLFGLGFVPAQCHHGHRLQPDDPGYRWLGQWLHLHGVQRFSPSPG